MESDICILLFLHFDFKNESKSVPRLETRALQLLSGEVVWNHFQPVGLVGASLTYAVPVELGEPGRAGVVAVPLEIMPHHAVG
jgi:hypothetical protein